RDLLEVIEDRTERTSTLIATQLPPTAWHAAIGDPSVGDAICDRLVHRAHKLTLKGPTMRDPTTRRDGKPRQSRCRDDAATTKSPWKLTEPWTRRARPQLLGKLQNSFPRASTGAVCST